MMRYHRFNCVLKKKKNMNFHDGNISKSSQPEGPDGPRLHIAG